jgi:hypothetical protein
MEQFRADATRCRILAAERAAAEELLVEVNAQLASAMASVRPAVELSATG